MSILILSAYTSAMMNKHILCQRKFLADFQLIFQHCHDRNHSVTSPLISQNSTPCNKRFLIKCHYPSNSRKCNYKTAEIFWGTRINFCFHSFWFLVILNYAGVWVFPLQWECFRRQWKMSPLWLTSILPMHFSLREGSYHACSVPSSKPLSELSL